MEVAVLWEEKALEEVSVLVLWSLPSFSYLVVVLVVHLVAMSLL